MSRLSPFVIFVFISIASVAQTPKTASEYMQYLSNRDVELSNKYLNYMSEVAHGHRARKIEKKRQVLISEIRQSLGDATRLHPFQGDASLRDVYKNYWDILLKVFNEDYHKIVDMEEIAEQSYDNMEAYLLAQEKAEEVLHQESRKIGPVYEKFAASNNIRLIDEGDSKLEKKLRKTGLVNDYYHKLFLIHFKSFKQEIYVWDSFNKKDLNALEQNNNTLIKYSEEGLAKLDTIKAFSGDGSVLNACRKVLEFYRSEAKNQAPGLSDYLVKSEDFAKVKKSYDAKPQAKRTQADVDVYNKAVTDINKAVGDYNNTVKVVNDSRTKVLENWETAVKRFMDTHVPKA
jgi:hypothetical protein